MVFFVIFKALDDIHGNPVKKHSFLIPFAWIYGIVRTLMKGISSNVNIKSIKKQVKRGNDRLSINQKIGVRTKNTQ